MADRENRVADDVMRSVETKIWVATGTTGYATAGSGARYWNSRRAQMTLAMRTGGPLVQFNPLKRR